MTDVAPRSRSELSPTVAVGGFLLIATIFLSTNPSFGVMTRSWPWERFRHVPDLLLKWTFVLWLVTGIAAIALAFIDNRRARGTILLVLCAPLLTTAAGIGAVYPLQTWHFGEILLYILLGAGLWLQVGKSPGGGRTLALIAALLFFWTLAVTTDAEIGASRLQVLWHELTALLSGETVRPTNPDYLVWQLLPRILISLAAALAIIQSLARNVWVARVGALCLALGLAFPIAAKVNTAHRVDVDMFATAVFEGFTEHGFALWLLGAFVVADAMRGGTAHD